MHNGKQERETMKYRPDQWLIHNTAKPGDSATTICGKYIGSIEGDPDSHIMEHVGKLSKVPTAVLSEYYSAAPPECKHWGWVVPPSKVEESKPVVPQRYPVYVAHAEPTAAFFAFIVRYSRCAAAMLYSNGHEVEYKWDNTADRNIDEGVWREVKEAEARANLLPKVDWREIAEAEAKANPIPKTAAPVTAPPPAEPVKPEPAAIVYPRYLVATSGPANTGVNFIREDSWNESVAVGRMGVTHKLEFESRHYNAALLLGSLKEITVKEAAIILSAANASAPAPEYPQYFRASQKRGNDKVAYIRRDTADEYYYVYKGSGITKSNRPVFVWTSENSQLVEAGLWVKISRELASELEESETKLVFPQYIMRRGAGLSSAREVYVVRTSPTEFSTVYSNRVRVPGGVWGPLEDKAMREGVWCVITEAEARALMLEKQTFPQYCVNPFGYAQGTAFMRRENSIRATRVTVDGLEHPMPGGPYDSMVDAGYYVAITYADARTRLQTSDRFPEYIVKSGRGFKTAKFIRRADVAHYYFVTSDGREAGPHYWSLADDERLTKGVWLTITKQHARELLSERARPCYLQK